MQPPMSIRVSQQPDGSLIPDLSGNCQVAVTFNRDDAGGLTGLLSFAGSNQAALTYDQSNSMIVSYHVLNVMADAATMQSIENIIHQLNSGAMFGQVM